VQVHAEGLHGAEASDACHGFLAVGDTVPVDELHHGGLDPLQGGGVAVREAGVGDGDALEHAPLLGLDAGHQLAPQLLQVTPRGDHAVVLGPAPWPPPVAAAAHGLEAPRPRPAAAVEGGAHVAQLLRCRGAVVGLADLLLREGLGAKVARRLPERLLEVAEVLLRLLGEAAGGVLTGQVAQPRQDRGGVLEVAVVAAAEGAPGEVLGLGLLLSIQRDEADPGDALAAPAVGQHGDVARRLEAEEAGLELDDVARLHARWMTGIPS
jgi:hypothetical protein